MNRSITVGVNTLKGIFTLTEGDLWRAKATKKFVVKILSLKDGIIFARYSPEEIATNEIIFKKNLLDFLTRYQPL